MAPVPAQSRPNLVIVMPDQLRADALGVFGNRRASTPRLDAFAASGAVFTSAYAQHSVCSPSRVSMFTGLYPHTHGNRSLTSLIRPGQANLFRSLKDAGYHVAWLAPRGDTFAPGATEESVDEYGFLVEPVDLTAQLRAYVPSQTEPGRTWERLFYAGRRPPELSLDYDEAATRSAEAWLAHPPASPWVLFLPLIFPHPPFWVEEPWFSLHDRDTVPSPRPPRRGPEPAFMAAMRERYGIGDVTDEMWREVVATYYGMVSRVDSQFGRVQDAVRENGLTADTVTFFFTDHGEYLGDFGLVEKWPAGVDEVLVRDPLIIGGAGIPSGVTIDALTEMVDVLPTVLDLAQATHPAPQFGRSLVPLLSAPGTQHRDAVFSEGGFRIEEEPRLEQAGFPYDLKADLQHEQPEVVGRVFALRTREWTYVYRLYESDELYARTTDPSESRNVIDDPANARVVAELRARMLRWFAESSDVLPPDDDPRAPTVELEPVVRQYRRRVVAEGSAALSGRSDHTN